MEPQRIHPDQWLHGRTHSREGVEGEREREERAEREKRLVELCRRYEAGIELFATGEVKRL